MEEIFRRVDRLAVRLHLIVEHIEKRKLKSYSVKNCIHFFGTKDDLTGFFKKFDSMNLYNYVLCGLFESDQPEIYEDFELIPNLGISITGDNASAAAYLVLPKLNLVKVQSVPQRKGRAKFAIDQIGNEPSCILRPSGVFNGASLIAGDLGTVKEDSESLAIYKDMVAAMRSSCFKKVKSYFVGPQAMTFLESGQRLTAGMKRSTEYDLSVK